MSRVQRSFENFALLQAASEGSASAVRDALDAGADINASDSSGRTVLTCALTADRWETIDASDASFMSEDRLNVLRIALSHPDISLYTLNAPQESINDVTPLGMAAWLDMPHVVQLLLECSAGAVSVDGMDTDGATPLMYAARDGRLQVVQQLLSHGARPDFRDRNHRSSIQFALPHPSVLWACERALRSYRWCDYKGGNKKALHKPCCIDIDQLSPNASPLPTTYIPPAAAFSPESISLVTDNVIHAVLTGHLSMIYSSLFSPQLSKPSPLETGPVVVNLPDVDGWSPIHYCVSVPNPSIEMLDALFRAGADVSLFTVEELYTPLHCLARLARISDAPDSAQLLYQFTVHLVQDLRAPLSARDKNEETCIHVAAEHGECIDVLLALLECDPTGSVRNLRNSRGLTALEVAKPHLLSAFSLDGSMNRPESALSDRTIRPNSTSPLPSIGSLTTWIAPDVTPIAKESADPANSLPPDFDPVHVSERLIENIQHLSIEAQFVRNHEGLNNLESIVSETSQLGNDILVHFRRQVYEVAQELRDMRQFLNMVDRTWYTVSEEAEDHVRTHGDGSALADFLSQKCSPRGSEDSQSTAVGEDVRWLSKDKEVKKKVYSDVGVLTESPASRTIQRTTVGGVRVVPWPEWLDSFILSADSTTYKVHLASLIEIERELFGRDTVSSLEEKVPLKEPKLRSLLKNRRRQDKVDRSGASKLKAWLKKKIAADKPSRLEICYDLDDPNCAVGREIKHQHDGTTPSCSPWEREARGIHFVLSVAARDLSAIDECLHGVDQLVATANHSISRVERLIKRTVKIRESMVRNLRLRYPDTYEDIFAFSPNGTTPSVYFDLSNNTPSLVYSSPPSSNSSPHSSARSSLISLAATLTDEEDEDTRALRRLLLRKINAHINGAYDEIDRASVWMRVVKNVLRELSVRTSPSSVPSLPSPSPASSFVAFPH